MYVFHTYKYTMLTRVHVYIMIAYVYMHCLPMDNEVIYTMLVNMFYSVQPKISIGDDVLVSLPYLYKRCYFCLWWTYIMCSDDN